MTRLDPTLAVTVLLQAGASARTRASADVAGSRASAAKASQPPLAQAVATALARLEAIPRTHPDRRRLAVRYYLESVLQQRLGASAQQDARWPDLLDAVQSGLQADPALARAADALGRVLVPD